MNATQREKRDELRAARQRAKLAIKHADYERDTHVATLGGYRLVVRGARLGGSVMVIARRGDESVRLSWFEPVVVRAGKAHVQTWGRYGAGRVLRLSIEDGARLAAILDVPLVLGGAPFELVRGRW